MPIQIPAPIRVIHVGPDQQHGGVGSYTKRFAETLRSHVTELVEVRHGGPGSDSVAALRARRRALIGLLSQSSVPTIVHVELSGGSVESFWPTVGLERHGAALVSATVHDPPGLVWWPARSSFLQRRRVLSHGLHYPSRPLSRQVERSVFGKRLLFATSWVGAQALELSYPSATVCPVLIPERGAVPVPAASTRERAVGLFGLVYRGKGFEYVQSIRASLPADITIRIAGRGTEQLPPVDGVEVLGGLDDDELGDFFSSIRALIVPYGDRSPYGEAYPSSAVVADAITYLTPVVCTGYGALRELGDEGGVVVLPETTEREHIAAELASLAGAVVSDGSRLDRMSDCLLLMRDRRNPDAIARSYVSAWLAGVG